MSSIGILRHPMVVAGTLKDRAMTALDRRFRPRRRGKVYTDSSYLLADLLGLTQGEIKSLLYEVETIGIQSRISDSLVERLSKSDRLKVSMDENWQEALAAIYVCVRARRPEVIVETGVGVIGATSAYILQGLDMNNKGSLHSIDPDKFSRVYDFGIGNGIPSALQYRQTVYKDTSRRILPMLLGDAGPIDIFIHDGCHTYKNMRWEFEVSWNYLRRGGILISDDAVNSSIDFISDQTNSEPYVLLYSSMNAMAFLRKNVSDPNSDR